MQKIIIEDASGETTILTQSYKTYDSVPAGFYKILNDKIVKKNNKIILPQIRLNKDLDLNKIIAFFSEKSIQLHAKMQIKHKLAYIFEGPPGTGKTTVCYFIANYFVEHTKAVVFIVETFFELAIVVRFLEAAKNQNDNFMSIIIFDECELVFNDFSSYMKKWLDSQSSIENNLFLFTTNKIEDISPSITNRPSRIQRVISMNGIEDEISVFEILNNLNKNLGDQALTSTELNSMIPTLVNKTTDEIKSSFTQNLFTKNLFTL